MTAVTAQNAPAQTASLSDPAPTVTFRSGVSNVRIDAQVADPAGNLITGLTKDDFIIYDEGKTQPILYFGRESEPVSLVLLLDISGSMRKYIEQVASVARQALRQLRPRDRVAIMVFAKTTKVRLDFTDDLTNVPDEIRRSVDEESVGRTTSINDALLDAAKYVDEHAGPAGRRAILILTDNLGLNYKSPDDPVIQALYGADAVLSAMVVGKAQRPEPPTPGHYVNPDFTPPDVFKISDMTGGEAVKAERSAEVFPSMLEKIRTRYGIQYHTPEGAQGFRNVRVELSPSARLRYPDAIVRARKGYFANK